MINDLEVKDELIAEAVKVGNHKSKSEAVAAALEEYVKTKKRLGILDLMGKVDYFPDYDYKELRRLGDKRIPKGD